MSYLVPTALILFLLAAVLQIDFYFKIVYLLSGVYMLARLWARYGMQHLHAQRRLVNRAFPGESVLVELVVRNTGRLPIPWIEIHDSLPVNLISPPFYRAALTLHGEEERRFTYTLNCYKRGYYTIGPLRVQTGDVMGATPDLLQRTEEEYIIVYPRVVGLEALGLPTHSPLAQLPSPTPLFEDPTRVIGVREYTAGDSPRRIHWTASASTGQLLVKRYQPAIARESLICLDLESEHYDNKHLYDAIELAVVATASIANHISNRERLSVGLATQAVDPLEDAIVQFTLPPRREQGHLMSILEVLARVQMMHVGAQAFTDFLQQQSMSLSWGSTVIVITGQETVALLETLVYLRHTGFAVALILIMPVATGDEMKVQAEMLKIPTYRVWREEALKTL